MTKMIDNYKDCPLGLYLDILEIYKDEGVPEIDRQVAVIARLAELTEDEVLALPLPDYAAAVQKASFLGMECQQLPKVARRYKVADWTLLPVHDLTHLTAAQYIDAQTYMAKGEGAMAEVLSIILLPEGHKYNDGYDIGQLQGDIRANLSVADTLSLCAFFLARLAGLTGNSLNYSVRVLRRKHRGEQAAAMMLRIRELREMILQANGGGLPISTRPRRQCGAAGRR